MRTRILGVGGPEVSVVGLGTNNFGRRCDYDQTLAVIDAAIDAGVTLFDTADIYGQGMSEEYIGRALEGRRDQVVIATKFGSEMDERPEERRGSPDYIQWAVEGSLRRLRTDVIRIPFDKPMRAAIFEMREMYCVLATLETDQGLTGEGLAMSFNAHRVGAIREMVRSLEPLVIGLDPRQRQR